MSLTVVALVALPLVLLGGCSKPAAPPTPVTPATPAEAPATLEVTAAENNTSVDVTPGQKIKVVLEGNPTTGYTWAITSSPEFLKSMGEPVFESEAASGMVGAGGKQTLEFEVTATGSGKLELGYLRPFEKDVPPTETFKLEIVSK